MNNLHLREFLKYLKFDYDPKNRRDIDDIFLHLKIDAILPLFRSSILYIGTGIGDQVIRNARYSSIPNFFAKTENMYDYNLEININNNIQVKKAMINRSIDKIFRNEMKLSKEIQKFILNDFASYIIRHYTMNHWLNNNRDFKPFDEVTQEAIFYSKANNRNNHETLRILDRIAPLYTADVIFKIKDSTTSQIEYNDDLIKSMTRSFIKIKDNNLYNIIHDEVINDRIRYLITQEYREESDVSKLNNSPYNEFLDSKMESVVGLMVQSKVSAIANIIEFKKEKQPFVKNEIVKAKLSIANHQNPLVRKIFLTDLLRNPDPYIPFNTYCDVLFLMKKSGDKQNDDLLNHAQKRFYSLCKNINQKNIPSKKR